MKVVFKGEAGIDEGGLTREFLLLIVKEIFDPNLGMFKYNPDN